MSPSTCPAGATSPRSRVELIEQRARVVVTPATNYIAIAERWVAALRAAYAGTEGTAEALERAAADIDELMREQRDARPA